jgi:cobalamin synthase
MRKRLLTATAVSVALLITLVLAPPLVPHLLIALFILVVQEFLHTDGVRTDDEQ